MRVSARLCTFPHVSARFCALRVVLPQRNRIAVGLDTLHIFPSSILFRKRESLYSILILIKKIQAVGLGILQRSELRFVFRSTLTQFFLLLLQFLKGLVPCGRTQEFVGNHGVL